MSYDTSCLYSTVRNDSGKSKFFAYLPPHGRELDASEEFSVLGELTPAIIRNQRVTSQRHLAAFANDVENHVLAIVKTPNPILYDEAKDESKMLRLNNESLGVADPCWEVSLSESD